jgi:hypothetical protein
VSFTYTGSSGAGTDEIEACFTNDAGEIICSQEVTKEWIITSLPPDCSAAHADLECLWPDNHKFVTVNILGVTDPDGDPVTITITGITSDEPTATDKGSGGAQHAPDAAIEGGLARIRAERSGQGNGRVYVISFISSDGKGGVCEGRVQVNVPHDQRPGRRSAANCEAVDDGQNYDATKIN